MLAGPSQRQDLPSPALSVYSPGREQGPSMGQPKLGACFWSFPDGGWFPTLASPRKEWDSRHTQWGGVPPQANTSHERTLGPPIGRKTQTAGGQTLGFPGWGQDCCTGRSPGWDAMPFWLGAGSPCRLALANGGTPGLPGMGHGLCSRCPESKVGTRTFLVWVGVALTCWCQEWNPRPSW